MFVIAGATGHVGGAAAANLLESGDKIRVILRDAAKSDAWTDRGADVVVGSLDDPRFLTEALDGASGFFTLLPADLSSFDFSADQHRKADAIGAAVEERGVPHVVLLSSHGAELEDGTGPVTWLHYLEDALRCSGTRLTAVRSGYHQENIASVVDVARQQGTVPSFLPADTPVRMVATQDVGALVARCLVNPPDDSEVIDIQGPWYSMGEVTDILAAAIGKPLELVEIPPEGWIDALMQAGFSQPIAEVFAEMYAALADGRFTPVGDKLVEGTTPIQQVVTDLLGDGAA